jgi:predicted RNase H-like HicB family nuclease
VANSLAITGLFLCYNEPMNTYRFPVVIEDDEDGFFAYCPDLQGCYTQGKTFEEALGNIRDALRLHIEDRLDTSESIPQPERDWLMIGGGFSTPA